MELLKFLQALASNFGYFLTPNGDNEDNPPSENRLTIEVVLKTGVDTYLLNQYQRLNGRQGWKVLLKRIYVPYATTFSTAAANATGTALVKSPTGKAMAAIEAIQCGYLNLQNTSSELIRQAEPLTAYLLDQNYMPGKGEFNEANADFTTTNVKFTDQTVVDANNGKSVLIVVQWIDVKIVQKKDKKKED